MEMSLPWAELVSDVSNATLIGALIVGVLATYAIVVSAKVKEDHLKLDIALADARAGEANKRAAEAELELFKLKAPRQLNSEIFKRELASKPKWRIVEFWFVDASDCRFFATDITVELAQAGWVATFPKPLQGANTASENSAFQSPIESWGAHATGVSIVANSIEEGSPQAILMGALANALPGWQVSGGRDSSMRPGTLRIVVAPRM